MSPRKSKEEPAAAEKAVVTEETTTAAAPAEAPKEELKAAPAAKPAVKVKAPAEEAPAAEEDAAIKPGDIVSTKYGKRRVRKVFSNGDISIATPAGQVKRLHL